MAKYRRRPEIVDAEVYRPGMEDGTEIWCSWWGLKVNFDCKGCTLLNLQGCNRSTKYTRPYVNAQFGRAYIVPDSMIVTDDSGKRSVWAPDEFEREFEPAANDGAKEKAPRGG